MSPTEIASAFASVCESTTPPGGSRTGSPFRSTTRLKRGDGGTPVIARYRSRCPARTRTATVLCGSTAMTPGSWASVYLTSPLRGSTKFTVTSCRSAFQNCVWMRRSVASVKTRPIIRMATANEMPKTDAPARNGCRAMFRSTMRPAVPRYLETSGVSSTVRRYRAGASGRIASAGGIRTARTTAPKAPAPAAMKVSVAAPTTTRGGTTKCNSGNRK